MMTRLSGCTSSMDWLRWLMLVEHDSWCWWSSSRGALIGWSLFFICNGGKVVDDGGAIGA